MADCLIVFRLRVCRASGCGCLFWICRRCDRGHRYCSDRCRQETRRRQRREANRRHQQSLEGRLDHRDRQRAYRRRCRERVTDQGRRHDRTLVRMALVDSLRFSLPGKEGEPRKERYVPSPFDRRRHFRARCVLCGRSGDWIDPFREGRSRTDRPDPPSFPCRALENRDHCRAFGTALGDGAPGFADRSLQSQQDRAASPNRSLPPLDPRDPEAVSPPARHPALRDAASPGLHRFGGAVAARGGHAARPASRGFLAFANLSRRGGSSRLGAVRQSPSGPRRAPTLLLCLYPLLFARAVSGVLL